MYGLEQLLTMDGFMTLCTLSILEIVLGIDNLVFIAILVARLEPEQQPLARKIGLSLAMITRCLLLSMMSFLTHLTAPLVTLPNGFQLSGRDLVLLGGGLFLLYKSTKEIHEKLEEDEEELQAPKGSSFGWIIAQIVVIDIIFSLDSVITAVGIADSLAIMILAVVISVLIMLWFSAAISEFINNHPTVKMLALSFLILIGVMLVAEGTHHHIEKGYIYFAMFFALANEMLNLRTTRKRKAKKQLAAARV